MREITLVVDLENAERPIEIFGFSEDEGNAIMEVCRGIYDNSNTWREVISGVAEAFSEPKAVIYALMCLSYLKGLNDGCALLLRVLGVV